MSTMDPKTMSQIRQQHSGPMGLMPPAGLLLDYIDGDLLPACKAALRLCEGNGYGRGEVQDSLRAAIAKAEQEKR